MPCSLRSEERAQSWWRRPMQMHPADLPRTATEEKIDLAPPPVLRRVAYGSGIWAPRPAAHNSSAPPLSRRRRKWQILPRRVATARAADPRGATPPAAWGRAAVSSSAAARRSSWGALVTFFENLAFFFLRAFLRIWLQRHGSFFIENISRFKTVVVWSLFTTKTTIKMVFACHPCPKCFFTESSKIFCTLIHVSYPIILD